MTGPAADTEAELEAFRQRWRQEVSARNKQAPHVSSGTREKVERPSNIQASSVTHAPVPPRSYPSVDYSDEIEPQAYHDLPDKEESFRLGADGQSRLNDTVKEPVSALEHYERAVERESQGQLGDSVRHYRKAFKLDEDVHEVYKKKHFPPSYFAKAKATAQPLSATPTSHDTRRDATGLSTALKQMVEDFSILRIEPPPPPTDASPATRSLLGELPEEILSKILGYVAAIDVTAFARLAQVCKRLTFLVLTEESIWKQIAMKSDIGFPAMHYDYICHMNGTPIEVDDTQIPALPYVHIDSEDTESETPILSNKSKVDFGSLSAGLLVSKYGSSWREMFRSRPRIRFNGCYISTVNYTRAGAANTNSLTWGAPIHIVTYYRYLRFFRDGSVISLLTTLEPGDVVHYLTKANIHSHHRADSMLPTAMMKDALRGRWRLSGPASSHQDLESGNDEVEGDVHIETMGVIPKYTYRMHLSLAHAGKSARNNKLAWRGYWSHNRLTDDVAEFALKNDRAFYWSRVKSYDMGHE